MKFVFPLKLTGSLNAREHFMARSRRVRNERRATALAWRMFVGSPTPNPERLRLVVTLTRIAPRTVDSDNLAGRLKGVRDEVATQLGIDDRNPRVEWRYEQRKGLPKAHAVEVWVETAVEHILRAACGEPMLAARFGADACSTRSTGAPRDERAPGGGAAGGAP